MKKLGFLLLPVLFSCAREKNEVPLSATLSQGKWIDLTYSFSDETLYWPTAEKFRFDTVFVGETPGGFYYEAFSFCAAEHGGTHLDAPVHFARGKWTADEIPLDNLCGDAVVIDVSVKTLNDPDYQIGISDLERWEETWQDPR